MSGNTLYLGRRVSDVFMRVYDKHRESKLDHYKGCWRFEVQYNNRAAWTTMQALAEHNFDDEWLRDRVLSEFMKRGISGAGLKRGTCAVPFRRDPRPASSSSSRLAWLKSQVRPTVDQLVQAGYREEVLVALGLRD
jgi:DNA relaxase NicK